ncbi:MAG TPA: NapC/NirT family cytochrome c [Gallionella sp.]|nr:NapC/NirT family cytochrome c [Gallionella sp.]
MSIRTTLKAWWHKLRSPSPRSLLALTGSGFAAGIIFWGGFNMGMDETNRLEFCISCHEMRDTVYQEYKKSVHYSNRTGVRAICSDCHVPKTWGYKMLRKMQASFELWGELTGSISTPQKFEAKRLQLARQEWARMRASDSRECRNCHSYEGMDMAVQVESAKIKHLQAAKPNSGKTCIDCHFGLTHNLPDGAENYL